MGTGLFGWAFRAAFVAALVLGDIASAHALEAFWQGRRSAIWEHGFDPKDRDSNWYSEPPLRGGWLGVPTDDAVFAPGAVRTKIRITGRATAIRRIVFLPNAPRYTFDIREGASLSISTGGIFNRALSTPTFIVRRDAAFIFRNETRLASRLQGKGARILIDEGGTLEFLAGSSGGNAVVANAGEIVFRENSSAGRMTITNRFATDFFHPHSVRFLGRSNGGSASFYNQAGAILDFSKTLGEGRTVTTGRILNFGEITPGRNSLAVQGDFIQEREGATGNLSVEIAGGRFGAVRATGLAQLGGRLRLAGDTPPGNYLVLRAERGLRGRFELYKNVNLNARLDHFSHEVILRIFE